MASINSTSSSTAASSMLRITGLATGLDTDNVIKQLMQGYQTKLDKMKQEQQYTQWKQDAYREMITGVTNFRNTYFDILNKEDYMLSENSYSNFNITTSDSVNSSAAPGTTITAGAGAVKGNYTVEVLQLAKASTITGDSISNTQVSVTNAANWSGKTIKFNVNDMAASITLGEVTDLNSLVTELNKQISSDDSLKDKLSVSNVDGKLQFNILSWSSIKIADSTDTTAAGIQDLDAFKGKAINPSTGTRLVDLISGGEGSALKGSDIVLDLTYNGTNTKVTLDNSDGNRSIGDLISAINSQTKGAVTASFSQLTGKFELKTADTGASTSIKINSDPSSDLRSALGLSSESSGTGQQDAVVNITPPGGSATSVTKTTNNFTIDSINYTLVKEGTTTNITIAQDNQKTFDKIKNFIDKYNELVDKLQNKVQEKKDSDYKPLTDEQKEAMNDEEIEKWENKAKQGILRNDTSIEDMLNSMRRAFFDSVENSGVSLGELGLTTSSDYTQGGKIILEKNSSTGEFKLKEALDKYGDKIADVFMKQSTSYPSYSVDLTNSERNKRYAEEGIFQRINDIMQDYTTTSLDSSGNRGILVEKAGIADTLSAFDNDLYNQMKKQTQAINDFIEKMNDKEESYYQKFAKLETAMNQLNSQQAWLTQQFGS